MKKIISGMKTYLRHSLEFMKDEQVEIRIRVLVILQFCVLAAIAIGTGSMVLLRQPFTAMIPNLLLLPLTGLGLFFSWRKNFEAAAILMIVGCADITLPEVQMRLLERVCDVHSKVAVVLFGFSLRYSGPTYLLYFGISAAFLIG